MCELTKLRWRCRRGMREMDLLLEGFLNYHYTSVSPRLQQAFVKLLDEIDQDILDWVMQRRPCPERYMELMPLLQKYSGARTDQPDN